MNSNVNVKQFSTDNDMAINEWKDSRLKKLEDFTKDLGRSSSAKRTRRDLPGSELTTIKHNNSNSGYSNL